MTDATVLVLASAEGKSGYATQSASAVAGVDPARLRGRGRREGGAHERRARGRAGRRTAPCSSRTRSPSSSQYFAWDSFGGARAARGAELPRRAHRRARLRREGDALGRRARSARPAEGVRLRGVAEAARDARRAGRRARRRLGPAQREARRRRRARNGTCAAGRPAGVRAGAVCALARGRRGGIAGRPRRGGRRRHLHHARPLPRHRRSRAAECSPG